MQGLSIKLPAELRQRLADEAKRRNITQSAIVRELIEQSLADISRTTAPATCAEVARGLIGTVRSGRRDLATNKVLLKEAMLEGKRGAPKRHR